MAEMPSLPERRTLNQKFSAYCKVCWEPVYCLWISSEDPAGLCGESVGNTDPMKCSLAVSRFQWKATIAKARRDVWLKPALTTPLTKDAGK